MKYTNGKVCGRDVTTMEDIDWVSLDYIVNERLFSLKSNPYGDWFTAENKFVTGINGVSLFYIIMYIIAYIFVDDETSSTHQVLFILAGTVIVVSMIQHVITEKRNIQKLQKQATHIENIQDGGDAIHRVKFRNRIGLYNSKRAELVLSAKYDFIEAEGDNFFFVVKDGKCGLYDAEVKKFAIACNYDEILDFDAETVTVIDNEIKKEIRLKTR